jgi:hypothetical protein
MKSEVFRFKAVSVSGMARSFQANFHGQIKKNLKIWFRGVEREVELFDNVEGDASAVSLISPRRVCKSITHNHLATLDRWENHFREELSSGCEEQQRLG